MFRLIHDFTRFPLHFRRFPYPVDALSPITYNGSTVAGAGRSGVTGPAQTIEISRQSTTAYPLTCDYFFRGGLSGLNNFTFPTTNTSITGEELSSSGS